jgi:hypothetical protein
MVEYAVKVERLASAAMEDLQVEQLGPELLLEEWSAAFNACNLPAICRLYDARAVLWGTTAHNVIADPAAIEGYFRAVFGIRPAPQVQVTESMVRAYGDFVVLAGTYSLHVVGSGQVMALPARFTFALHNSQGRWLIAEHHSSMLPSGTLIPDAEA